MVCFASPSQAAFGRERSRAGPVATSMPDYLGMGHRNRRLRPVGVVPGLLSDDARGLLTLRYFAVETDPCKQPE